MAFKKQYSGIMGAFKTVVFMKASKLDTTRNVLSMYHASKDFSVILNLGSFLVFNVVIFKSLLHMRITNSHGYRL